MEDAERISRPDDPERCQSMMTNNQCNMKGVMLPDGTRAKYCGLHGGPGIQKSFEKDQLKNYQLTRWKSELAKHSNSKNITNLSDEVGILRMVMETKLNEIKDPTSLILNQASIMDLVVRIEKTVKTLHIIQVSIGQLLDKTVVMQIGDEIVNLLKEHCTPEQLEIIIEKLGEIFTRPREVTLGK